MRKSSFKLAALLTCTTLLATSGLAAAQVKSWRFDVLLDGRRIGEHEFIVTDRGDQVELLSQARFKVSALFVPLYRYQHDNRELWRHGCLAEIDARTLDNGAESVVRGARNGDRFALRAPGGAQDLPECIKTFAYWDADFLRQERLLNPQTGEYQRIETDALGRETLNVGGRSVEADRHALRTDDFRIDVWYSPEGDWLALESRTAEGRRLRYERR